MDVLRGALHSLRTLNAPLKLWVRRAATVLAERPARSWRLFRGEADADGIAELVAITARTEVEQESLAASFTAEISLDAHLRRCLERADRHAISMRLPDDVAAAMRLAAGLHDIGKADLRFQSLLRGGVPVSPSQLPLAKSSANGNDRASRLRARVLSGYPERARHELQSVAMLESTGAMEGVDWDLLLHLVASHHGFCRPFAPVSEDAEPVEVSFQHYSARSDHELFSASSGVSQRFWRLIRRYGWWGLAWLETLLRLADHRVSELEEKTSESEQEAALAIASN